MEHPLDSEFGELCQGPGAPPGAVGVAPGRRFHVARRGS